MKEKHEKERKKSKARLRNKENMAHGVFIGPKLVQWQVIYYDYFSGCLNWTFTRIGSTVRWRKWEKAANGRFTGADTFGEWDYLLEECSWELNENPPATEEGGDEGGRIDLERVRILQILLRNPYSGCVGHSALGVYRRFPTYFKQGPPRPV